MDLYKQICQRILKSPHLYIYWALSAISLVLTHLNSGLKGSPWLGGTSIVLNFLAAGLFYYSFNYMRGVWELGPRRNFLWLVGHVYLFRLVLFVFFLPFVWMFFKGTSFTLFTLSYTTLSLVPEAERAQALIKLFVISFPWLCLIALYLFIDQAARSHIVAQGSSRKTLRRIGQIIWKLKHVLVPFLLAEILLMTIYMHDLLDDPIANQNYWGATAIRILMVPLKFTFEMGSTLWMAKYLKDKAHSLLSLPDEALTNTI